MNGPRDPLATGVESEDAITERAELDAGVVKLLFDKYQGYLSPVRGGKCPMYPSCSHYSRLSIAERGLLVGLLATSDRLLRCGKDLRFYSLVYTRNGYRYEDLPR